MKALSQKLDIPFELHNRWWSPQNIYQKNFSFIVEEKAALPQGKYFRKVKICYLCLFI